MKSTFGQTDEVIVTSDRSVLERTEGFWSKREILFNTQLNQVVLLDPDMTARDLRELINHVLERELFESLKDWQKNGTNGQLKNRSGTFVSSNSFKKNFNIINSSVIQNLSGFEAILQRKKANQHGKNIGWKDLIAYLEKKFPDLEERSSELDRLLMLSILECPNFVSGHAMGAALFQLKGPSFLSILDRWVEQESRLKDIVSLLIKGAFSAAYGGKENGGKMRKSADQLAEMSSAFGIAANTAGQLNSFFSSCRVLVGLLRIEGKLLLPLNAPVVFYLSSFSEPKAFTESLLSEMRERRRSTTCTTVAMSIFGASTIQSLDDIPADLRDLSREYDEANEIYPTFGEPLVHYSNDKRGTPFPINRLNGKRKKPDTVMAYTTDWLKLQPDVPKDWIVFSETLDACSQDGQAGRLRKMRPLIQWAVESRAFESPRDIKVADLRDAHNPARKDTFHVFLKSGEGGGHTKWAGCSGAFKRVWNYSKLDEDNSFLPINPFDGMENPFRSKKRGSGSKTHRMRMPNNHHEAMLQVLLSPNESGEPTYSFVKDELKRGWFDWRNPKTGNLERMWCPSVARCLAFMLMLVPRGKQARWLDQGLMDEKIWDVDSAKYVENTHALRAWKHPVTGQSHLQKYGRSTGVIQPIQDDFSSTDSHCFFINTNKTQMWDPQNKTGYELWWPRSTELKETDTAVKLGQRGVIDRPYLLVEEQIKWLQKYDPNPEPITFSDVAIDSDTRNDKEEYPYFTPIFRDLTARTQRESDGTIIFPPVSKSKLDSLLNAIAYEAERRLIEQGFDAILTEPSSSKNTYKGRKCLYDMHSLRVFGLSYLIEIGVPLPVAQLIMGHETAAMTMIYNKQSSEFVRNMLAGKLGEPDVFGDWDAAASTDPSRATQFLQTNSSFRRDQIPTVMVDDKHYAGYSSTAGGLCLVGGNGCDTGQVNPEHAGRSTGIEYQSVQGGCGNCRFFASTPAHLVESNMIINELMIKIRDLGKQQSAIANLINEAQWTSDTDKRSAVKVAKLTDTLRDMERRTEPLVREWMNRFNMTQAIIARLDDYKQWMTDLKSHDGQNGAVILFSSSTFGEVADDIELRMEKTGEFELARQALLGAHLHGGIEQASQLTQLQVNQFMDRIIQADNSSQLLLKINCEKTRNKVAFLMSELLASTVGSAEVQNALDNNKGLSGMDVNAFTIKGLEDLMEGIFKNAEGGENISLENLLPNQLNLIENKGESENG